MQRLGFASIVAAVVLVVAAGLVPVVVPHESPSAASAEVLASEAADVLLRISAGDGPRTDRDTMAAHLRRLSALVAEVDDGELHDLMRKLPARPVWRQPDTIALLARIAARAHEVSAERAVAADRLRASRAAGARSALHWSGVLLLAAGLGATYVGYRRTRGERRRLEEFLPATDESLDMRAVRLVESHAAAHERLMERSRERRDLLAEKRALEDFKLYDPLTRLLRDDACIERAVPLVGEYLNRGVSYFVVMMDLDLFKRINDTYGHDAGDAALRHFAMTLADVAGEDVLVSRQHAGGDEFVAIGPGGEAEVLALRDRLNQRLKTRPLRIAGVDETFVIGSSMGYTLPSEDVLGGLRSNDTPRGRVVHLLKQLKHCDNALYLAKRSGRGSVKRYEPGLAEAPQDNAALEPFSRIDRHVRTDFPHLPAASQAPIVGALERAAEALEQALRGVRRDGPAGTPEGQGSARRVAADSADAQGFTLGGDR